jgi:hypothetical protein
MKYNDTPMAHASHARELKRFIREPGSIDLFMSHRNTRVTNQLLMGLITLFMSPVSPAIEEDMTENLALPSSHGVLEPRLGRSKPVVEGWTRRSSIRDKCRQVEVPAYIAEASTSSDKKPAAVRDLKAEDFEPVTVDHCTPSYETDPFELSPK